AQRQVATSQGGMSSFSVMLVASIPRSAPLPAFFATEKGSPVTEKGHLLTRKLCSATWGASLVAKRGRRGRESGLESAPPCSLDATANSSPPPFCSAAS